MSKSIALASTRKWCYIETMSLNTHQQIKQPTSAEFSVIFWVSFLILVGFGAMCLIVGYRAPVERAELASKLIWCGYGCIAAGITAYFIRSILRRM
jgi:hypothetical protein